MRVAFAGKAIWRHSDQIKLTAVPGADDAEVQQCHQLLGRLLSGGLVEHFAH